MGSSPIAAFFLYIITAFFLSFSFAHINVFFSKKYQSIIGCGYVVDI